MKPARFSTKRSGESDPDEAAAILPMEMGPPSTVMCDLRAYIETSSLLDIRIKKGTDVEEAAKTLHPCWVAYRICYKILKPCSLNNYDGLAVHHGQQSFLTIFLLLLGEFQDPTRNPAVEEQAIMRIHRIGQKHTVSVRRFIVKLLQQWLKVIFTILAVICIPPVAFAWKSSIASNCFTRHLSLHYWSRFKFLEYNLK
ncbi:hypothetical protein Peur_005232 [Populus x canadensis]